MGTVELRAAGAADAEAVAAIWSAGWPDGHLGNVPDELVRARTPEFFRTRTAERLPGTTVATVDGTPAAVQLPASVELAVSETEPGVKGDTVSNVTKPATLETGASVQVPLFVNVGDRIKVDTREGRYISRA